jgi:hypothetical protein
MKKGYLGIIFVLIIVFNLISAANYPLEIINIKPSGTGNPVISDYNRIFRAYPSLEYNIKAAVIGGMYPFIIHLIILHLE